jgi:alkanesulfonate monooxygenase SsuD/methylene tetrahydromethanopterin reductase-like flavin-dependent oxidoreductase (luciferase family)
MKIGVGLPATVPGAPGRLVVDWAAQADAGPFAAVGVLDRLRYDNVEPLTALAAAAAVTRRVELVTMIVIAPLRQAATLAKQAASVHALSEGRLVLGMGIGARADDYELAGVPTAGRGERFGEQLGKLRDLLEDPALGPRRTEDRPRILVGGSSGPALARMARFADGYVHGGGPPRAFERAAGEAVGAWADGGRPGRPELWGQGYFGLGPDAERGADYLLDYYAFTGPFAQRIAEGNLTTPQAVKAFVRGYAEAGCDGLILFPTIAEPQQLDRLADVMASA